MGGKVSDRESMKVVNIKAEMRYVR